MVNYTIGSVHMPKDPFFILVQYNRISLLNEAQVHSLASNELKSIRSPFSADNVIT